MPTPASQYPTAIDGDAQLLVAADRFSNKLLQTTLAAQCLSTDQVAQLVASPGSIGFPAADFIVSIEDEQIFVLLTSGSNLGVATTSPLVRGYNGTTATTHPSGKTVSLFPVKANFDALKAAIVAIETALGTTGAFNFGSAAQVLDFTVTSAAAIASPGTPQVGQRLTVFATQDGTGWAAPWGTGYKCSVPVDTSPSKLSIFEFVGRADGNWWCSSPPILGIHP